MGDSFASSQDDRAVLERCSAQFFAQEPPHPPWMPSQEPPQPFFSPPSRISSSDAPLPPRIPI